MKRYELEADQVLFTADTHFSQFDIIKVTGRPYKNEVEMDTELIRNWNEVVKPDQVVFHLGDFTFKENVPDLLDKLNGEIVLIRGNHDGLEVFKHFKDVHETAKVVIEGQRIVMCHYMWDHNFRKGTWHLHGHTHGKLPVDRGIKRSDVGVDLWDYRPVSFEQLKNAFRVKRSERGSR
jgi:calcineurin-like phosphoesterase family protein